jgi:amino-acid N-acetyltransferase
LVSSIENLAKRKKIYEIYLLTETAENFFKKLDYCIIQKELAPEAIKNTSEFSSVCPQSAVLMTKHLKG